MSALMFTPSREENVIESSFGTAFVRIFRPDDVLHADGKQDELFGERVVENPARHDGNVIDAARTSREFDANADVSCIDTNQTRREDNGRKDQRYGGNRNTPNEVS
jgi:hypothetical protein